MVLTSWREDYCLRARGRLEGKDLPVTKKRCLYIYESAVKPQIPAKGRCLYLRLLPEIIIYDAKRVVQVPFKHSENLQLLSMIGKLRPVTTGRLFWAGLFFLSILLKVKIPYLLLRLPILTGGYLAS